jgi:hypothetical protein
LSIFAITFRIADDAGYADRYDSVVDAIKKYCAAGRYWDETTSFFIVEYGASSVDLISVIDGNSTFLRDRDLLVAINLSNKGYAVLGTYEDPDLDVLLKKR